MSRRARIVWATLAAVLAVITIGAWIVLSLPPFGGRASGERLARVQASPEFHDGQFVNDQPEAATDAASLLVYLTGQFGGDELRVPPAGAIPVVAVDKAALAVPPAPRALRAFWIGHAGSYVEIDGLRLLLDPVFSDFASPFPLGPKRFHPPPVALADLPTIDAVLISHEH